MWGAEQRAWLKRTLLESDADWRVLISPTPIVGPDRLIKNDNQANPKGFWTEGQAFLDWIKAERLDNLILICGDRHRQYHAVDERNGRAIHEFSCGPTCDKHTAKAPPIEDRTWEAPALAPPRPAAFRPSSTGPTARCAVSSTTRRGRC